MPRPKTTPRKWINWYFAHGEDVSATCERFGISRATFYRWLGKYRENPKKPLTRRSTKPKTRRPPGYTVGQLLAVALLHNRHPDWSRKRVCAVLSEWHQNEDFLEDSMDFLPFDLSFLTSQLALSEATVGRMLNIIRRRCPFCEGPKNSYKAEDSLVDPRLRRTDGHTSLGCAWAVIGLPDEIFEQRLPLAKLREIVREAKENQSVSKAKKPARSKRKQRAAGAERQLDRVLKELEMKELMRQIEGGEA